MTKKVNSYCQEQSKYIIFVEIDQIFVFIFTFFAADSERVQIFVSLLVYFEYGMIKKIERTLYNFL